MRFGNALTLSPHAGVPTIGSLRPTTCQGAASRSSRPDSQAGHGAVTGNKAPCRKIVRGAPKPLDGQIGHRTPPSPQPSDSHPKETQASGELQTRLTPQNWDSADVRNDRPTSIALFAPQPRQTRSDQG